MGEQSSVRADGSPPALEELGAMGAAERLAAITDTNLSRHELNSWVAQHPGQAPLVNGELPWIALHLADLD